MGGSTRAETGRWCIARMRRISCLGLPRHPVHLSAPQQGPNMVRKSLPPLVKGVVAAAGLGLLLAATEGAPAQERAKLQAASGLYAMAFSPDGTLLAAAESSGDIVLWDVTTAKLRHILKGHANTVTQLAFSPDGRTLIATNTRLVNPASVVKHWDVTSGREKLSFVLEEGGANRALSPDGRLLVTVRGSPNKTTKVWDLATKKEVASLEVESPSASAAALTPDGKV